MFDKIKSGKINNELKKLYVDWYKQVENVAPEFFSEKNYSNPYYIGVPEYWMRSKNRILIVGEQGFMYGGNGKQDGINYKQVRKLQEWNIEYYAHSVLDIQESEHPFWNRARHIDNLGWACAWTFLDKICWRRDRRSKLSSDMREKLHSVDCRVLQEEIRIIQPTHIVFFGWFEKELMIELPGVFHKLNPNGLGDDSLWKDSYTSFEYEGIWYLFTYNPHSPYWKNKPATYEEDVISELASVVGVNRRTTQARETAKRLGIKLEKEPVRNNVIFSGQSKSASAVNVSPIVTATSAYAVGKTVNKVSKKLTANPNSERYEKARKEANDNRVLARYLCDDKKCATCEYWECQRFVDKSKTSVEIKAGQSSGYCKKKCKSRISHSESCVNWKKSSELK